MKKLKNAIASLFLLILTLVLFAACGQETAGDENGESEATVPASVEILKIGKADCIIINTGTKIVMIDTGEEENYSEIRFYLNQKGYKEIDTLILTHYDKDHIGSATKIIDTYGAKTVIEGQKTDKSQRYLDYHQKMDEKGITPLKLTENYFFKLDSCEFEIFIPKKNKYESNNDNNSSLVISMKCGEVRFLFCADALEERMAEIIGDIQEKYDLIKLPHHGSYLENYNEILKTLSPKYGVITCSNKNPTDERTLSALADYGVDVYQTRLGQISIYTDGREISINQK